MLWPGGDLPFLRECFYVTGTPAMLSLIFQYLFKEICKTEGIIIGII